jgi:hypothetical protein
MARPIMFREADVEERVGCLQEKKREVVMEENVARYGALFLWPRLA